MKPKNKAQGDYVEPQEICYVPSKSARREKEQKHNDKKKRNHERDGKYRDFIDGDSCYSSDLRGFH